MLIWPAKTHFHNVDGLVGQFECVELFDSQNSSNLLQTRRYGRRVKGKIDCDYLFNILVDFIESEHDIVRKRL